MFDWISDLFYKNKVLKVSIDLDWMAGMLERVKTIEDLSNFQSELPEALSKNAKSFVLEYLPLMIANIKNDRTENKKFCEGVGRTWGDAIASLKVLYTISIEFAQYLRQLERSPEMENLFGVLIRLHVKGCRTLTEVICLLENGLADGAHARWRSLHEVAVTATFINSFYTPELLERFIDSASYESIRGFNEYQEHSQSLGYEKFPPEEALEMDMQLKELKKKYKSNFFNNYGWAAVAIKGKCSFAAIERAAGLARWRPFYRMSSHSTHSEAKGLFFELGRKPEDDLLLAGKSIFGLADPGQSAGITFSLLTSQLLLSPHHSSVNKHPELIYFSSILDQISNFITNAFIESGKSIGDVE